MKPSLKPFLAVLAILFAGGTSADTATDQHALVDLFADSCLKTYPTYSGIDDILAHKGLEQNKDGSWNGDGFFANPAVKRSGGGRLCFVSRHKTDPRNIHTILIAALSKAGAKDVKATIRGRKTDITFTLKGIPTRVRAGPLVRVFADIAIFQQ